MTAAARAATLSPGYSGDFHFGESPLSFDNTVRGYLQNLNAGYVRISPGWCELEPQHGTWDQTNFRELQSQVADAANLSGPASARFDVDMNVRTTAPVWARPPAMQFRRDPTDPRGYTSIANKTGCYSPANDGSLSGEAKQYPDGKPAPNHSDDNAAQFQATISKLANCLAGNGAGGLCVANGVNLLPHVRFEIANEVNYRGSWETGECLDGTDWYTVGLVNDGTNGTCRGGHDKVGRIQTTDADFYTQLADAAATALANDDVAVGLGGLFSVTTNGNWGTTAVDPFSYLHRVYTNGQPRKWDAVGLDVFGNCGRDLQQVYTTWYKDPRTGQVCDDSAKVRLDSMDSFLANHDPNTSTQIWLTIGVSRKCYTQDGQQNLCSGQQQFDIFNAMWNGVGKNYCTGAYPTRYVTFSRLNDGSMGQFAYVGTMSSNGDQHGPDPKALPYYPTYTSDNIGPVLAQTTCG